MTIMRHHLVKVTYETRTFVIDINSELEKINIWLKLNKLSLNVKGT